MSKYRAIGAILTVVTAVLGLLTATGAVHWIAVAIAGVLAGLWWGFGHVFLPHEIAQRKADHAARNEARRRARS